MSTNQAVAPYQSLISGIQGHLATTFSRKVAAAAMEVSDFMDYEAANGATPREKQSLGQASRLLISRRHQLVDLVAREFNQRFDAKLNPPVRFAGRGKRLSLDTLSLVQDEQMEEDIAISHCGNRLKEQCDYELFALTRRIGILTGRERIPDEDNPVFPRVFARCLMQSLGAIESGLRLKLALFKSYGPIMLDIVPETLAAGNVWLAERGIDVEVDERYGRPILTPERNHAPEPQLPDAGEIVDILHQLSAAAAPAVTLPPDAQSLDFSAIDSTNAAAPAATDTPSAGPAVPTPISAVARTSTRTSDQVTDSRSALSRIGRCATPPTRMLHAARKALREALPADEAMVADLVTVMFDRLFADSRIPAVLKPTVSRLQMPFLQLALRDQSLFSNAAHPARKLIDVIAEFGMTQELSERDTQTIDTVARIVEDVVRKHASDPAAFKLAYHRLDDLFYHHEESALQRDATVTELQQAEALEGAQAAANEVINARLHGLSLPLAVAAFVQITWRDVLVRDHLNGGPSGSAWKLGLATLDELLKSIQPAAAVEARTSLARGLPSLLELLKDGMIEADVNPMLADEFLIELQQMHQSALRGRTPSPEWVLQPASQFVPRSQPRLSPSARLAELGLACGSWIEMRQGVTHERWRLSWITSYKGLCVLKHHESGRTQICSFEDLRERVLGGAAVVVEGIGLASGIISDAFRIVARKVQRDEAPVAKAGARPRRENAKDKTQPQGMFA